MGKSATSTAVAVRENGAVSTKKQITRSEAVQLVRTMTGQRLKDAKNTEREKRDKIAKAVGGQITRVDESVVAQAEALMTRLAMIANRKTDRYSGGSENKPLEGIVKKLGAIVGELKAFMLTNRAVGLFETIDDGDFIGWHGMHGRGRDSQNPFDFAGKKTQREARELLEQYEIVEDAPKSRKGQKGEATAEPKRVSIEDLTSDADGEFDDEGDDEPVCRVCGCTEDRACADGCNWIEIDGSNSLCSACEQKSEATK